MAAQPYFSPFLNNKVAFGKAGHQVLKQLLIHRGPESGAYFLPRQAAPERIILMKLLQQVEYGLIELFDHLRGKQTLAVRFHHQHLFRGDRCLKLFFQLFSE